MVRPRGLIIAISTFLFLSPSIPTKADWQFTKWGDSLDTVISYDAGKIRKAHPKEIEGKSIDMVGRAFATGPYNTKELQAQAYYLFTNTQLTGVDLSFSNSDDGLRALEILKSQYGKPNTVVDRMTSGCKDIRYEWDDRQRSNLVRYRFYMCSSDNFYSAILYTPIMTAKETGL